MSCKICFSPLNHHQDPQFLTYYTHCQNCECIMLEERFHVDMPREKQQYDHHNNTLENEGYVLMFENFLDFCDEAFTCKDISVLDFGSGPTPVLSFLIQKRGFYVDCYDKFYQPLPVFKDKTYTLITSTEVFEHLDNPVQTLTLLANHLTQGGYIALMTLFHDNCMENFWKWWYRRDPTHITFYTPKTIEVLANTCGLDVVKSDGKRTILLKKR